MRISFVEALNRISERMGPLPPVVKHIPDAIGFVSAGDVRAEMSQPPFPRSPYDGYALRAADTAGASKDSPLALKVVGQSFAGSPANATVGENEAVRIMTGGVVPDGADCVMPQEKTDEGEDLVRIFAKLKPYENYCETGEDFNKGDVLITANTRITAAAAAVLSSAGIAQISVFQRPRVAIISTGDELVPPSIPLSPGKIYSANSTYMVSRLAELGVVSIDAGIVVDDVKAIASMIEESANRAEIILIMGGVSVGQKDYVPEALSVLGAEIAFHGINMKPGMPAAFAVLNGTPVFALSGNPFAAAVTFELLVRPAIAIMASDERIAPKMHRAQLAADFTKKRPVNRFVRATLTEESVLIPEKQGNGQLRSMIGTNCIAELLAGDEPLLRGSSVNVYTMENNYYE